MAQRFVRSAISLRFMGRVATFVALTLMLVASTARAQVRAVILDAPNGPLLPNLTPRFTVRALNFPVTGRPLQFTVFITRNPSGEGPYVDIVTTTSMDSVANLVVNQLLPDSATVQWKASVRGPDGITVESVVSGARKAPKWLRLLNPSSGSFETRRPEFSWESGAIDPAFGSWSYSIDILSNNTVAETQSGISGTKVVLERELEANKPYSWRLIASVVATGQFTIESSKGTFFINDPALPTTTLLYQNFPNPFPSSTSFATCFWFDVQNGGSQISLDIVDLRGTLVKTIIPSQQFQAGIYGRGPAGGGSNCDNRFIWNGTATDGRSVPGGVYLARFLATGRKPQFKKLVFKGR